ncbi:solute carrier family 12 member 9-like isoform X2 [Xenia sp. Carnegie-2017]|uniref:solute carrier family 12 member 9-like isoform X2 n=1 Tax=Xenia sp. Carnegie-2017 TaxID=2897299 RepID=UPI001F040674|nr:solute carrier family 12 member 9-like isoform X2 [Xenia sp. Carnegie-2017]
MPNLNRMVEETSDSGVRAIMGCVDDGMSLLNVHNRDNNHGKLSTFFGVIIPCILSMFSIILFLRIGYLIGQVGFIVSCLLLFVAYFVTGLTTLSVSAISTNGNVKGGGAYFMISRALGPEFGGSIGVIFYVANIFSSSLYLIGFSEAIISAFGKNTGALKQDIPTGYWYGFLYRSIALLFNLIICLVGAGMFAKTTFFIFLGVMISLGSSFVSFFIHKSQYFHDVPTENCLFGNNTPSLLYTGFNWTTLKGNLWVESTVDYQTNHVPTILTIFGVLFNGVTGVMAGANMSGDLKNAAKSIPKGTLEASGFTFVMYLLLVFFTSATCTRPLLVNQYNYLQVINIEPVMTTIGVFLATLSASLSCLIGATRVLQAVANDNLLGSYVAYLGRGYGKNNEPIWAVLVSWIFVQLVILENRVNALAPIVSMFFLLSYGVTNLACFVLKVSSAPNFRPTFQYYSKGTAFLGMVSCFAIMIAVDPRYALISVAIMIIIFLVITYRAPITPWGDVSQAVIYHQVRKYLLRLSPRQSHVKYWRPQILLLVSNPRSCYPLIDFVNDIKKSGLYILGNVIVDDFDGKAIERHKLEINQWYDFVRCAEIKAFVDQIVAPSIRVGVQNLLMSSGLGGMRPNTVILGYFDYQEPEDLIGQGVWQRAYGIFERKKKKQLHFEVMENLPKLRSKDEQPMRIADYIGIIKDSLMLGKNVCVARNFVSLDKKMIPKSSYIDVWPMNASEIDQTSETENIVDKTYLLMLQLSCILNMVPFWEKRTKIRLISITRDDESQQKEKIQLKNLLHELRITGEVHIVQDSSEKSFKRPIGTVEWYAHLNSLMKVHSGNAAVIFTNLPRLPEQENQYNNFMLQMSVLSDNLPPILMLRGVSSVISLEL